MTPLWLRVWHWTIALLFVILAITGLVLTYSTSDFALIDYALADTLHQVTGIAFSALFALFVVAVAVTGHWRRYRRQWQGLWARIRLHGANVVKAPAGRGGETTEFPPSRVEATRGLLFLCQQFLSIASVLILSPLLVVTGLVLLFPELAPEAVGGLAGLWTFAIAHYWAGLIGLVFLVFHAYISTVGGLKRMIKGR